MRVITLGMVKETVVLCPDCATEFAYLNHDIKITVSFGDSIGWVECPACGSKIELWNDSVRK